MDPLAFTEDDAFGVQPYEQFERLENEYEALAAKKRKALAHQPRETPVKKLRVEDVPGASFEEIMAAMTYGMRRKSRKDIFSDLQQGNVLDHPHLITEVEDSLFSLEHYESALSFYMMLAANVDDSNVESCQSKKVGSKEGNTKEEKKAAALAAGVDWKSDESDDESPQALREPPLPNLLKDEEHHHLIIDLCKTLSSLQRYWEALEIINLSLKLACNSLSVEKKEELRSLGAQIAYNIADPTHGWDCARYIVNQHPQSLAAWNCYYKVISRLDNRYSKHSKFLHGMRVKHKDCVPPMIIFGHQLTMISQHQAAAREYLEAYKLMPDNPLVNLCVGSALINLALGFRLQNKHQCVVQGLAFLYNNLLLCENSQEALYNIARAYHHVGLVSLAATYYEKVISMHEKDYPIPKLPNENPDLMDNRKSGYCDLRREAAYNLHLIYKKSGALDLARQVLKDHSSF